MSRKIHTSTIPASLGVADCRLCSALTSNRICEICLNIIVISVRVHPGQNPIPVAPTFYIDELMYVS